MNNRHLLVLLTFITVFLVAKLDILSLDYEATVENNESDSQKLLFWIKKANDRLFMISGENGYYRLPETEKTALPHMFQADEQLIEHNNLQIDEDIKQITISKSLAHGSVNSEVTVEYTDKETMAIIVRAIHTSVQMPGILNTATPNYDIVLTSDTKKYAFQLWMRQVSKS